MQLSGAACWPACAPLSPRSYLHRPPFVPPRSDLHRGLTEGVKAQAAQLMAQMERLREQEEQGRTSIDRLQQVRQGRRPQSSLLTGSYMSHHGS